MLQLNRDSLIKDAVAWKEAGVELPQFNIEQVTAKTKEKPQWVHFGAGNIFRAFIANAHQKLLNKGLAETGIISIARNAETNDLVYKPYDNLTLLVLMKANGELAKTVVSSIVECIVTDQSHHDDYQRLIEIFENPSLQLASFTITEKGYSLMNMNGQYQSIVEKDIENGLDNPMHTISIVTALAYRRYLKGQYPMTFVSMDNCSHNGDKLKQAVLTIAKEWRKRGFVEEGFIAYLEDEGKITFPYTMIDKITPRPSDKVKEALSKAGIGSMEIIVTSNNTYTAPFVNAEVGEYLVIEDKFTNGRPSLEHAGIFFTDRETVNKVETMKVTTCLNPLHTALAVTGCLLGYTSIAAEMKDDTLKKLVEKIGYQEGLKVVVDPKIIQPKAFLEEVLNERFANENIPDTPQRIATDTSQKVGVRFGETLKSYVKREDLKAADLVGIPLAIASWCRYLVGIDDAGKPLSLSPDPLLEKLQAVLQGVAFGDQTSNVKTILSNETIFGVNLYEVGLGEKIEDMFYEMLAGPGAVRKTLEKYLG